MSESNAVIFEFSGTLYDDAKAGTNALCIAVVKCVLPIYGRRYQKTTDPPAPSPTGLRAERNGTTERERERGQTQTQTRSPSGFRVECTSDVYMDKYYPLPIPGDANILKSVVIPTAERIGASPALEAPRTVDCVTETLRNEGFWILSDPQTARVTRVDPKPTNDSFLAGLLLVTFMLLILAGQRLCCPTPVQVREQDSDRRRYRTVSRLESRERDHAEALTAEEARPLAAAAAKPGATETADETP